MYCLKSLKERQSICIVLLCFEWPSKVRQLIQEPKNKLLTLGSFKCLNAGLRLAINCKVTPTTFYEISKILHICSIFRNSGCIRVVHIFWESASFVFLLFPRKRDQNSENLRMT